MNYLKGPQRIVCLTEETTELLYKFGEQDRIVGISSFTVRPDLAKKEKPIISTFVNAKIDKILALKPDLVIGFSDVQSSIAKKLIKNGLNVWVSNQRSINEIKSFIYQLGSLVNAKKNAEDLILEFEKNVSSMSRSIDQWKKKPKVYFEEWDDPLICGIHWISELISLAGGIDIFANLSKGRKAENRLIKDSSLVVKENPDIILVSWCGKKFKIDKMLSRSGWSTINAIKKNHIHEIDSSIILQPGPASLFDGMKILHDIFKNWSLKC